MYILIQVFTNDVRVTGYVADSQKMIVDFIHSRGFRYNSKIGRYVNNDYDYDYMIEYVERLDTILL